MPDTTWILLPLFKVVFSGRLLLYKQYLPYSGKEDVTEQVEKTF